MRNGARGRREHESAAWIQASGQPRVERGAYDSVPRGDPLGNRLPTTTWEVIREHERQRRQRLVRILALGVMIPVVLLIPSSLFPKFIPGSLIALTIVFIGTAAAFLLNRLHFVTTAGYSLIAGIGLALAWQVVSKVLLQHGVDALDLRYYDLMVLPILLSSVLVGRRGPFIVAGCASAYTIVSLLILKRTPELQQYWNAQYHDSLGSRYDVVALAVLFQWIAAVVGWLGADSVRRALQQAARADEVVEANAQILAQAREMAAQRQRLQDGIVQIQQVHAAIARGHLDARVRIEQGEILPIAMSLNLLLDRLTRLAREQSQRATIEEAAHELALAMRQARMGQVYSSPNYTGTVFDEVLIEFAAMRNLLPGRSDTTQLPKMPSQPYGSGGLGPAPASQPQRPAEPPFVADAREVRLPPWLMGGQWGPQQPPPMPSGGEDGYRSRPNQPDADDLGDWPALD
ncbi:MAG TPA: hypothetical protein VJN88_16645 [Ktedonobacterales bacterium]|nr:hypothetical protein [Ktedonobacterales bacterium]